MINFFTPFNFGHLPRSWSDSILKSIDNYLDWKDHRIAVLNKENLNNISNGSLEPVLKRKYNFRNTILKILIIISYIPFGIPALLIKKIICCKRNFRSAVEYENSQKLNNNINDSHNVATQALAVRRDETEKIKCPVALVTARCINESFYITPSGRKILLSTGEELLKGSHVIPNSILESPVKIKYADAKVSVINQDCLEAAQEEIKNEAKKVAVLMFSSPIEPGGAMEEGNNGQEEDLCRRSDLFGFMWDQSHFTSSTICYNLVDLLEPHQVNPNYHDMVNNRMIHVPQVTVFRSGKNDSYQMLEEPFKVGMLISPALDRPEYKNINENVSYIRTEDEEQLCKLIMTQLKVAYEENYDTVILGAFGCGAFSNPPELIAKFYKKIIDKYFAGAFKKIIFAILDDGHQGKHNPQGNFKPFLKCFEINV